MKRVNMRFILLKEGSKKIAHYKRYQWTESGISPRAIPSWIEDVIYADNKSKSANSAFFDVPLAGSVIGVYTKGKWTRNLVIRCK